MKCRVCGAEIPDDARLCENCGAEVDTGFDSEDDTKVLNTDEINAASAASGAGAEKIFDANEQRRKEQMKKMMEDKQKQLSEIEKRRNEKRQRQRRRKVIIIAIICAAAVAAAGIGTYYVLQSTNPDAEIVVTASPSPAVTTAPARSVAPAGLSTAAPVVNAADNQNNQTETQSWTSTGNGSSSGNQRTASNTSSSGVSSSNNSSGSASSGSTGSGSASSGGSSSGGSASSGRSSSGGSSSTSSSSGSGSGASTASAANSGIVTNTISSGLVTGGEVIYDNSAGKYLMTFVKDGVKYYANVSEGSTTAQIQNKSYTINADPTNETYNGNTIYEISSMTGYSGDYILADSGTKLLTAADLSGMSKYDLALARNEIYARHGRKFQTSEYNAYFSAKSWYSINPNYNYADDNSNLNEIEAKNVEFILNAEKR